MQRLDDVELRRLRAKSQLLDRQNASADAAELVRAVVSIQAQDRGAAALTMRARIGAALAAADVKDAVCERDRIVLTWSFRGTLHYHHASDVRAILQLIGPTFGRESARHRQLGVGGRVWDEARDTLLGGLTENGPMTRPQVRDLLAPVGVCARHGSDSPCPASSCHESTDLPCAASRWARTHLAFRRLDSGG